MQAALKEKQAQRKAAGEAQAVGGAPSAARKEIEALYAQHNPVRTTRVLRFAQPKPKVLRDTELRVLTGATRLPPGETC